MSIVYIVWLLRENTDRYDDEHAVSMSWWLALNDDHRYHGDHHPSIITVTWLIQQLDMKRHVTGAPVSRRRPLANYRVTIFSLFNPLQGRGNYSATLNNTKLVHWPLMGADWAGPQPAQAPPRCTKRNSPWAHPSTASVSISVLLSFVTFVHPAQRVELFVNVYRDVKRGQMLEAEVEHVRPRSRSTVEARTLRSRPRPNLKRPNRTMY